MPARSSTLWMLTALLLLAFPGLNFVYWPQVLLSGALPANSDSIGIPIFGSIILTLIASPLVIGVAWLCLRRYNSRTRLFAFRFDRPYRSALATSIFGLGAFLLCLSAVLELARAMPWYEHLWSAYTMLIVVWLLALRASLIEQHTVEDAEAEAEAQPY